MSRLTFYCLLNALYFIIHLLLWRLLKWFLLLWRILNLFSQTDDTQNCPARSQSWPYHEINRAPWLFIALSMKWFFLFLNIVQKLEIRKAFANNASILLDIKHGCAIWNVVAECLIFGKFSSFHFWSEYDIVIILVLNNNFWTLLWDVSIFWVEWVLLKLFLVIVDF